jgi:membrane associated rhomboid family serine protease
MEERQRTIGGQPAPFAAGLVLLLVGLALGLRYWPALGELVLVPARVRAEPWRLVGSAFLHQSFGALVANGVLLWAFGNPVERTHGRLRLVEIVLAAALAGGLVEWGIGRRVDPDLGRLGAGPVALGLAMAVARAYGRQPILLFGVTAVSAVWLSLSLAITACAVTLLRLDFTAAAALAAGALAGATFGRKGVRFARLRLAWLRFRRWKRRRRYKVIQGGLAGRPWPEARRRRSG